MNISRSAAVLAVLAGSLLAQRLTPEQRVADLRQLASLYAKNYGPYEWKKQVRNFDLYDLKPWLDRAEKTTDDLEFADLLVEYVASLDDAHDSITFNSTWGASLGFSVDIYDGKVLIDSISRARLPLAQFPFGIGDELVSMDGKPVEEWITRFSRYNVAANPGSTRRLAASLLTSRGQYFMPLAPRWTPEKSTIVVRRASTDALESYELTWLKSGVEMEFGPLPIPGAASARIKRPSAAGVAAEEFESEDPTLPAFMRPLKPFLNVSVPTDRYAVLNFGGRNPIFALPANFQRRLGGTATDAFFSGVFEAEGKRIGFIRIPSFAPSNINLAINQFAGEMVFFQQNTDGLIIDDMRNPGGSVSYCEFLLSLIMPNTFRTLGFEIRATSFWVASYASTVAAARQAGLPQWQIVQLEANLANLQETNRGNRARTGPISLNSSGTLELLPGPIFYSKPLIVLVDEMSASGGDFFPAVVQDNNRGLIVGMRTMGAGGNVVGYDATNYTEGVATVTQSLMNRKNPVTGTEYPDAPYVENIGVRPDVQVDYMTRENLLTGGRAFVDRVTRVMLDHIGSGGR